MTASPAPGPAFGCAVGAGAGFLSGLLGIGGGLVAGPALAVAGTPLPTALGTALWVVVPVAAVGVATELFSGSGLLHPASAAWVALGGLLGAPLGARWVVRLPEGWLRGIFIAFLLFAAARSFGWLGGVAVEAASSGVGGGSALAPVVLSVALGALAGIASSLFGIGGGVVVVPGLVYVVGGFGFHAAAATSLLAMIPTASLGAWLARRQGRVEMRSAALMVPAAVLAAAGAVLLRNHYVAPRTLAWAFGGFLVFAAARLLLGASRRRAVRAQV